MHQSGAMRFTWAQHLETARSLSHVDQAHSGTALALMGVALLLLLQDLEGQTQS
jgi:hypothetical protein